MLASGDELLTLHFAQLIGYDHYYATYIFISQSHIYSSKFLNTDCHYTNSVISYICQY